MYCTITTTPPLTHTHTHTRTQLHYNEGNKLLVCDEIFYPVTTIIIPLFTYNAENFCPAISASLSLLSICHLCTITLIYYPSPLYFLPPPPHLVSLHGGHPGTAIGETPHEISREEGRERELVPVQGQKSPVPHQRYMVDLSSDL